MDTITIIGKIIGYSLIFVIISLLIYLFYVIIDKKLNKRKDKTLTNKKSVRIKNFLINHIKDIFYLISLIILFVCTIVLFSANNINNQEVFGFKTTHTSYYTQRDKINECLKKGDVAQANTYIYSIKITRNYDNSDKYYNITIYNYAGETKTKTFSFNDIIHIEYF